MPGFGTKKRTKVASMRHRAWLQERKKPEDEADQRDDRGRAVFTWENVGNEKYPIAIERLFGGEFERARKLQATATHRLTVRYTPKVKREMRFLYGDRAFYIGDVENLDEANRFLVVICEEQLT